MRCRDCKVFQSLYGGVIGGGQPCSKDTTVPKRNRVYALDYACGGIVEVQQAEG